MISTVKEESGIYTPDPYASPLLGSGKEIVEVNVSPDTFSCNTYRPGVNLPPAPFAMKSASVIPSCSQACPTNQLQVTVNVDTLL